MGIMRTLVTMIVIAVPLFSEPDAALPGARIKLQFPELPKTLFALFFERDSTPQLYIALPQNYSPDRQFPLFVYLYGGDGGEGAGPGRGMDIMEGRDCIFVNMPLFKAKFDTNEPYKGRLISIEKDKEVICRAYTVMLKKVYETIPNIDTGNNIISGESNGAHSIAAIFENGDTYLMGLFRNIILAEGGYFYIKTYERYKDKNILYVYGDYEGINDWMGRKMRADLPLVIQKFAAAMETNRLNATPLIMTNTGHEVPKRFYPDIRRWVSAQLKK
ncbi:MAG: hypothetical protein HZC28_00485 [Spirochaetes bacterium]|nr:hypothetical protein [Spirochaetota bacterium]